MSVIWTGTDETRKPVTPNNLDLYRVTRSEVIIGYLFVALGAAAVGACIGIVAYVIAGTW